MRWTPNKFRNIYRGFIEKYFKPSMNEWKVTFAWHPITVEGQKVWLEFVEWRTISGYYKNYTKYRFINKI